MNDTFATQQNQLPDRLTISRLLVLTAFVGLGLMLVAPESGSNFNSADAGDWRMLACCILMGLSLPSLGYVLARVRRKEFVGLGGLLWLLQGLGTATMLPPVFMAQYGGRGSSALLCLSFTLPLVSLWFVCARLLAKKLSWRDIVLDPSWTERFGLQLGVAWAIIGAWILGEFYWEAFFE